MITVDINNQGDFTSVNEAINSVKNSNDEVTIFIKNGVYKERVEIFRDNVTLIGESKDGVIITDSQYALEMHEDGNKKGTFRSYTFLVVANNFHAYNITFKNESGFGKNVGQAIAVYAEGDKLSFKNCAMYGHQDTLYTGPLPKAEKETGGFRGPTENAPRRIVHQLYEDCYIEGEVDFIFGSAVCYFKKCTLFALDRGMEINSYYTAPSTYEESEFGYVFDNCILTGNCPKATVSLSRPWRNYAKAVFLNCYYSDQVIPEGFSDWNKPEAHETVNYYEYNGKGPGFTPSLRASFSKILNKEEASRYSMERVLGPDFK